jgi:hypothetical protein
VIVDDKTVEEARLLFEIVKLATVLLVAVALVNVELVTVVVAMYEPVTNE